MATVTKIDTVLIFCRFAQIVYTFGRSVLSAELMRLPGKEAGQALVRGCAAALVFVLRAWRSKSRFSTCCKASASDWLLETSLWL